MIGAKVLEMSTVTNSLPSAYYYVNGGSWQKYDKAGLSWNKRLASLDLVEGEKVTVGLVAVPEYYETSGDITQGAAGRACGVRQAGCRRVQNHHHDGGLHGA